MNQFHEGFFRSSFQFLFQCETCEDEFAAPWNLKNNSEKDTEQETVKNVQISFRVREVLRNTKEQYKNSVSMWNMRKPVCNSYDFLKHVEKEMKQETHISAHADGSPRSRVCARETLRSAPHRRERKFFGARVCRVAGGEVVKFSKKNSDQLSRQIRQF